jgi:NAD(P)-dependent dehydrogenase (short-subunit alcohol dehydrogenase family)
MSRHDATVVVNDLGTDVTGEGANEAPAQETVREIQKEGGEANSHFGDVTSISYVEMLISDVFGEHGRIDGVADFAGIVDDDRLVEMSDEAWDRVIRVHLRGHFTLLRAAGKRWQAKADDGALDGTRSFLAVTSRASLGSVNRPNYAAAKAGILGLVRTAARDFAEFGGRVNALMPTAYTRMLERVPDDELSEVQKQPPEKVAPIAAYLLGDGSEGVTGCTVQATGESVGIVSDPSIERLAFREYGWTVETLEGRFLDTVGSGTDLDKSGVP